MISLEECRTILGDQARGLSDADLEFLRQQLYGLADIAISCYLTRRAEGVTLPSSPASLPLRSPERVEARRSALSSAEGGAEVLPEGRALAEAGQG